MCIVHVYVTITPENYMTAKEMIPTRKVIMFFYAIFYVSSDYLHI